jgi:hypothetical protein
LVLVLGGGATLAIRLEDLAVRAVALAAGLRHIRLIPTIPRGRERCGPQGPMLRRRRNRPPETLRQKGRVGKGPLESPGAARRPAPTE